jgi:hypothetical protein
LLVLNRVLRDHVLRDHVLRDHLLVLFHLDHSR